MSRCPLISDGEKKSFAEQIQRVDANSQLAKTKILIGEKMRLYMETTKIPAERTAQEIAMLLAQAGATAVLTEYGKDRKISGLSFKLRVADREIPFSLPVRVEPVFRYLQSPHHRSPRRKIRLEKKDREQAERVAWRQLLRWIQAQLAMIDSGMVEAAEVFLPYVQVEPGKTLWDRAIAGGQLALPAPAEHASERMKIVK